jgi:hypothetical protein
MEARDGAVALRTECSLGYVGGGLDDADSDEGKPQEDGSSAELRDVLHLYGEFYFKGFCECYGYQWVSMIS